MEAYNKIYDSLVGSKPNDPEWKKKVDETIADLKSKGMTRTEALRTAAMELNTETTSLDVAEGVFLRQYRVEQNSVVAFNVILGGEIVQARVEPGVAITFPKLPSVIRMKNVEQKKTLLAGKTVLTLSSRSTVAFSAVSPERLLDQAVDLDKCVDGDYYLLRATATEVVAWNPEEIITPERVNLKVNFVSAGIRSGVFIRTLEDLAMALPSDEDGEKMLRLASEPQRMVNFINRLIADQTRETGMPGAELVVYGKVTDRVYTGRNGQERTGKNVNTGFSGFILNLELLQSRLENPELMSFGKQATESAPAMTPATLTTEEAPCSVDPKTGKSVSRAVGPDGKDIPFETSVDNVYTRETISDAVPTGQPEVVVTTPSPKAAPVDAIGVPTVSNPKERVLALIKGMKKTTPSTLLVEAKKEGITGIQVSVAIDHLLKENRIQMDGPDFTAR